MAARMPSLNMFVMAGIGIIFGGTEIWLCLDIDLILL